MKKGLLSAALAAVLTVAATGALAQEAAAPPPARLTRTASRIAATGRLSHGRMGRWVPVSR